jgi:tetratricopeptide (TPR) repeat protein
LRRILLAGLVGSTSLASAGAEPKAAPELKSPFPREVSETRAPTQLTPEADQRAHANALLAEALRCETHQGFEVALPLYLELLKLDPHHVDVQLRVGRYYLRANKTGQAYAHFQAALQANPDAAEIQALMGFLEQRRGHLPEAVVLAQAALKNDPSVLIAYRVLFECYHTQKKPAEAEKIFAAVLQQKIESRAFWLNLGRLYAELLAQRAPGDNPTIARAVIPYYRKALETGEPSADLLLQIAQCEMALSDKTSALTHLREAITLEPDSPTLLFGVAEMELTVDDRDNALRHYEAAYRLQPDYPELREKLATLYLDAEQAVRALPLLNELAGQAILQPRLHSRLTEMYLQAKQPARAEFQAQKALELTPNQVGLHIALVMAQVQQKKLTEAAAVLADARQKFPGSARVVYWEGLVLRQQKLYPQALESLTQARILSAGSNDGLIDGDYYCELSLTLELAGQKDRVESTLREGLKKDPQHSNLLNSLAYHLSEENIKLDEALKLSRRSLEIDPGNGAYLDTLGWIYFKMNKFQEALAPLQQAVPATKEDPVVLDHLAQLYVVLNRLPEAVTVWKKAVAADPEKDKLRQSLATAEAELKSLQVTKKQ